MVIHSLKMVLLFDDYTNMFEFIFSVLKTFIYDPLVEWSKPTKGRLGDSGEMKNEKVKIHCFVFFQFGPGCGVTFFLRNQLLTVANSGI